MRGPGDDTRAKPTRISWFWLGLASVDLLLGGGRRICEKREREREKEFEQIHSSWVAGAPGEDVLCAVSAACGPADMADSADSTVSVSRIPRLLCFSYIDIDSLYLVQIEETHKERKE